MTARITALLVTLALAFPAAALGQIVHRCVMAGLVVGACCCSHQHEGSDGPAAEIDDEACCDTLASSPAPAPLTPQPPPPVFALPAVVPPAPVPPPAPALAARPRVLAPVGARAPPPLHGRGIYLEVCAFLI
jgi:hypothetical protein